MQLDNDLEKTRTAVRNLNALRQDNLEDYFHDAIVHTLAKDRQLSSWLSYIFQCVYRRVGRGREGRMDLPLNEAVTPDIERTNLDLQIDIHNAFKLVTTTQAIYIYEYYYEGYTLSEIAARHHASYQAVHRSIQRGLEKMKGAL